MIMEIEQSLPEQWKGFFRFASIPINWLLPVQDNVLYTSWNSDLIGLVLLKRIFMVLPAFSILAGLWCTILAVYTLPFRSHRIQFIGAVVVAWWDALRSIWLFWAGMGKFVFVAFGSFFGLLKLSIVVLVEVFLELIKLPFTMSGTVAENFFRPGVPWIAFLMTLLWSGIEALVFTYTLTPLMSDVLSGLTGAEASSFLRPVLYVMLFCLISGSFACMHILVESIAQKDIKQIIQMVIVEFFVMFVEVMFLYRELVDSLSPWIAQQTGAQMGIVPIILFASFAWLGIRGMTWFLFARFGTPTLLALIGRKKLSEEAEPAAATHMHPEQRWDTAIAKLKKEQDWFQERAQALLEAAILPAFQVMAAGLNFCIVLFVAHPIFSLPFKSLADVGETKALLQSLTFLRSAK
ncbi:MAG: hypothetical protein HY400_01560 [Elusimicrobia bacterium]|nr:hypothetical protein [Elusimicrobiota bacterium]